MAIYNGPGKCDGNGIREYFVTMASHFDSVGGSRLRPDQSRPDNVWSPLPARPTLEHNQVHVFRVSLDSLDASGILGGLLSHDEVVRANRFHFERDRNHFSGCRAVLRRLLALYLTIPASHVRFEYPGNGKPQLVSEQNPHNFQFNVSHSEGIALIAIGKEHKLGIDVEKVRSDVDTVSLAERFFSARERATLRVLPDDARAEGFYACWTRKEAFLKATGDGLSFPLADFSVTTDPRVDPRLEDIRGDPHASERWLLRDIQVADGYRAALVFESRSCVIATYSWN